MIPLVKSKRNYIHPFYLTEDIIKEENKHGNFVTVNSFRYYDNYDTDHVASGARAWGYFAHYLVSLQDCSIEDMEI